MDIKFFEEILDGLASKNVTIKELHAKCVSRNISDQQAQQFLYEVGRDDRFELFIALYDATLKNNPLTAFKAFKEAYCTSDNIHSQITKSQFAFDRKEFLNFVKRSGVDFLGLMSVEEKAYYDALPDQFRIYRGVSDQEYKSKDYGISWSISEGYAKNYIYFSKNNVAKGEGGLIDLFIDKNDVLSVFFDGRDMEIIYIA